ncbi:MAG: hypothetical protein V3U24_08600 [Candidatus Neomarinimicrobiota bacterium]
MTTDSLVISDIRNFIPWKKVTIPPQELIEGFHINLYLDKTEEAYRLNLLTKENALGDLIHVLELDDPNLSGVAWACLGGIHTFNGNYRKAFAAFHISLDQSVVNDVKAYVFTELSNLLRKLGYLREAVSLLETALTMTRNPRLKWRIRTYIGLSINYTDPDRSLQLLAKSVDHYKETGENFRLSTVLRHMGSICVHVRDFKEAEKYLDEAMSVAVEHGLTDHQHEVINDKGWMLIQQGSYDEAKALFEKYIRNGLSPYLLGLALQNTGFLEFERQNYREAIKFHGQSLQLTTRYEMRDMAFEDYYKLGLCHEMLGDIGLADHFYSLGYRELEKELDLGLPVLGYRKRLLETYVKFLRRNQEIPRIDVQEKIFDFAMGKTLKEIRNVFHKNLFSLQLLRTKHAPELCRTLKINTRTYFLYQKKLGLKRGKPLDRPFEGDVYFDEYIESLGSLTWKQANKRFEADLFLFLLGKYQHSKKKLAEVLGVSYALVSMKTKPQHLA